MDTSAQLALGDEENDWYQSTLYKLIDGRYVEGNIIHIQYDISVDKSRTGAYTCQFQTGPFMTHDETVDIDTVLLYKQNHALFTQQALLSVVTGMSMEPKIGTNAPDDDKGTRGTESTQREEKVGTQKIQAEGALHDATIGTTASGDGQVLDVRIAAPSMEMAAPPRLNCRTERQKRRQF